MAKVPLVDVGSLGNPSSARQTINENSERIEDAFDNFVSRDGTGPNQMEADFDAGGYKILNVADPTNDNDGVNFRSVRGLVDQFASDIVAKTVLGDIVVDTVPAATAGQTVVTLSASPGSILNTEVFVDGVAQRPTADYTLSGPDLTTLTFLVPLVLDQVVMVRYAKALPAGISSASSVTYDGGTVEDYLDELATDGSANIGFKQVGVDAVSRDSQNKMRDSFSARDFGALGDNATNDGPSFRKAIAERVKVGGTVEIPTGSYQIGWTSGDAALNITAPYTDEPGTGSTEVGRLELHGKGMGSTILRNPTNGKYLVKFTGVSSGSGMHSYECHSDFSIMGQGPGTNGAWIYNKAYVELQNVAFQGLERGCLIESTLTSKFTNCYFRNCSVYGAEAYKGTGSSGVNLVTFDNCRFQLNTLLGFRSGQFLTSCVFEGCSFEGNGRHGNALEGGCELQFNSGTSGGEGGSGATFVGGYFESNGGGADVFITNLGPDYITVTFIGTTFNRNSPSRYVTNCIKTVGKVRLVLIGCAFQSFNGYTPSSGRKYVADDPSLILEHVGCSYADAVEAPSKRLLAGNRQPFVGSVLSSGVADRLPANWSSTQSTTGVYVITHNLGVGAFNEYTVAATVNDGSTTLVRNIAKSFNTCTIYTTNASGTATSAAFDFTVTRNEP